ncbi:MAG: glutaredoxin family protein [Halobacteriota archaeon]|nr:glutaredoxin family protein [Halobacteriota archaeon]
MDITVYMTKICPYCQAQKKFLRENNIEFEEIDILKDRAAAKMVREASEKLILPQTRINDKLILGFKEDELKRELGLK